MPLVSCLFFTAEYGSISIILCKSKNVMLFVEKKTKLFPFPLFIISNNWKILKTSRTATRTENNLVALSRFRQQSMTGDETILLEKGFYKISYLDLSIKMGSWRESTLVLNHIIARSLEFHTFMQCLQGLRS